MRRYKGRGRIKRGSERRNGRRWGRGRRRGGEGMEIRKLIRSRSSGLEGNWVSMLTDNATETS